METQNVSELDYLQMTAWQKFCYKFISFFKGIPTVFLHFFRETIPALAKRFWNAVKGVFLNIGRAAKYGDWKTRMSFVVMGTSQLARKQILRGILFLVFEAMFILYMVLFGAGQLAKFGTLGTNVEGTVYNPVTDLYETVQGDNSQLILLYGILTLIFLLAFVYAWYQNVRSAYHAQLIQEAKQNLPTAQDDLQALVNEKYHTTLLAFPLLGITIFTLFPIIFMVFIAFTNYDQAHMPPANLFTWVGFENFGSVLGGTLFAEGGFGKALLWTVIWAFFATFSNYILGMIVAIIINKKGIKLKKLWRTVLIMTIAVPQFVSLLLLSQMFADTGIINVLLKNWGWIDNAIPFLSDGTTAKVTIILVNIWIGIPYTMLISTGILMNIPEDLYESARIDGAGPVKSFFKITLPYMLHVTTPYLISQFIGNLNNFNVIYLLTGGGPKLSLSGGPGETDLLITWLYSLTMDKQMYGVASVVSILMFIITAVISLVVYNRSKAVKNEEDFM